MTKSASDIQTMIDMLAIENHHIRFEVGKLGRCDRFSVYRLSADAAPVEVMELQTQHGEETLFILDALDGLVESDADYGVSFNNCLDPRYAYCIWDKGTQRSGVLEEPKIGPIYRRRMQERERICSGTLKRGHKDFGFFPLDGHR